MNEFGKHCTDTSPCRAPSTIHHEELLSYKLTLRINDNKERYNVRMIRSGKLILTK